MVGEASGRMQKADCRDEIALPAAMLAWLKCGKQRTRNSRKRFLVFFCSLFVKARVVYRLQEVNIVSWNEGPAKIDIRDWSENHEKMSRGITLTADEMQRLIDSVQARDAITMLQNMTKPARTNDYER